MKPELFLADLKFAARSLWRSKGLAITVIVTLALGIGANAAIFSVVRGVLLRPLNNRDEDRIIYIRQSAKGIGVDNTNFSVPEIVDIKASVKSVAEFGDFSVIGFTMIGLGEPREVRAGVVGGTYFDVMGLHPALGRLIDMRDDGPNAEGAAVLTYRFWKTAPQSAIPASSEKPFASARAPQPSSACSNRQFPILRKPKSSPTLSPARTISPPPWCRAASIA